MKYFLIAGEASGDRLGAALMEGLKSLDPAAEFAGVGGPLMEAQGLHSLFPMEELSVMGIAEVLPKYFHLRRRIRETADAALSFGARAVIGIDSPDFCLRADRLIRDARPDQFIVHYVAPSVWAWRPGRAARMARVVDHVLALLPFEPPYMQAAGMTCDFTGHPVTTEPVADPAEAMAFRAAHGIGPDAPLLIALPGSRRGEVTRLAPVIGAVVAQALEQLPDLRVVLPTVRGVRDTVTALSENWAVRPVIVEGADNRRAAFAAGTLALAASGTVSLELAASGLPMVIAYDMNPISRAIIFRLVKLDTVTLVNLVTNTRTVPEFLGTRCRADLIAPALLDLIGNGPARAAQLGAMRQTMELLGRCGEAPGLRAARSILAHLPALG